MTTLNTYKVWRPSDGIFWLVDADTAEEAVITVCGEIVGLGGDVVDAQTGEVVFTAKTFHYGINGDEKFEYASAIKVSGKEMK